MVLTENSLQNAYIGEYVETWSYSYTFTGKTMQQVYDDGRSSTFTQGTPAIDSVGLTTNYSQLYYTLPHDFSNANKITLTMGLRLYNSGAADTSIGLTSSSTSDTDFTGIYNSYNNYNQYTIAKSISNFSHSSNGVVTNTFVVNLQTKTWSMSYSDGTTASPSSGSITDQQITKIRGCQNIQAADGGQNRIISISVDVE